MTKKFRALTALLLAAALLAGCGTGRTAPSEAENNSGTIDPGPGRSTANTAVPTDIGTEAPAEIRTTGNGIRMSGDALTMPETGITLRDAAGTENGAFLYGEDENRQPRFFLLDAAGETIRPVEALQAEAVLDISASPDGALHVLAVTETGGYEILSLAPDGSLSRLTLDEKLYEDNVLWEFEAVNDGFFLAVSGPTSHAISIDRNGSFIQDYGSFRAFSMVKLRPDLTLLIFYGSTGSNGPVDPADAGGTRILEVDSSFQAGETYIAQSLFTRYFPGVEGKLLAIQNNIAYEYDYASGTATALVNTFLSGMGGWNMLCLGEDLFFSIEQGKPMLWRPSAGGEAQVLTLATYDLPFALQRTIADFNAGNSAYIIEPIDYSSYDTYETHDAGLTKLALDIISGNAPDIYDLSLFSPQNYAAKGLLEDLKPWFEADEDMSYEDLIPSVAAAAEFNDGLYELIPGFQLLTLAGDLSVVGSAWSVADFIRLTKEVPHEMVLGLDMTRREFMSYVLAFMHGELYSEETLDCDFTSENFLSMLEFTASLPAGFNYDGSGSQGVPNGRAYAGEQLLVLEELRYIVEQISWLDAVFSGEAQFVGFPTDGGTGFGLIPEVRLAMSSSGGNKYGVWEFFKYLLSDSVQVENKFSMGLPVMRAALDTKLDSWIENAMENTPAVHTVSLTGPVFIEGVPVDESMRERVLDMIGKIDCVAVCDETILNIVMEQAEPFFSGGKPAAEAAAAIQSRVKIYLSEQFG